MDESNADDGAVFRFWHFITWGALLPGEPHFNLPAELPAAVAAFEARAGEFDS